MKITEREKQEVRKKMLTDLKLINKPWRVCDKCSPACLRKAYNIGFKVGDGVGYDRAVSDYEDK